MHQNDRVLARRGARELSVKEVEFVSGAGQVHTDSCSLALATATQTAVGDCDGVTDIDNTN